MKIAILLAVLGACSGSGGPGSGGAYDFANSPGVPPYQQMCQVCHGESGEGGLGPALRDTTRSLDDLTAIISERMPANQPGSCTGDCAKNTAELIANGFTTSGLACDAVTPAPRRLRLLTRREYRNTIHDVFGDGTPAMSCARATDCSYRDSCEQNQCEPSACDTQTFVFDAMGQSHTTVHVAGDFNQWAGTIAGGGLPLVNQGGLWVGTFAVGAGHHTYKFVLDQTTWVADPRAPSSEDDGFGGKNAVVVLACPGATSDVTSGFPVETRSAGFPFDTDASAALVTDAHVDAYLTAAGQIAAAAPACDASCLPALGKRLFRRPLTSDELARYGAMPPTTAMMALLMSPNFLYRSELGVPDGDHFKLTPYEVAAALSYTFLATTPDDELLAAADQGKIDVEAEARRLVADPRARDQVGEFALQWVGGQAVLGAEKRADLFPDFTDAVKASLVRETRAFAADVVFDGTGKFTDLIAANYTVLDPVSASFYGTSATGRVPYTDGTRAGLLGHASVLATTAHSDQTSPVERGLLIRRNLLCEELPPPPPNGGGLPAVDPSATTRERFQMHSATPECAGCHQYIDNVGFGLERFDPVGRWRTTENGMPIDASGDMNDVDRLGTEVSAPYMSMPQLATTIASSQGASTCFVRQWMRFARGLRESLAERCGRLWVQTKFDAAGGDVREMMVQSVLSPDFVERR